MRVLLLGGTSEARTLAARMHPDVDVISSLAGRVPDPALPVGEVRIGGFGGVDGMRSWLLEAKVDAVVDATHPYAATITSHAAEVCGALGLPHLVVARPAWPRGGAVSAASDAEAVEAGAGQRFPAGVPDHRTLGCRGVQGRRCVVPDPRRHRTRPADAAAAPSARAVARTVPLRRRAGPVAQSIASTAS